MKLVAVIFLLTSLTAAGQKQNDSFLLARTTSTLSMLSYSAAEDRLGGTKVGYLDSSILLKVIDSSKESYQVQLSQFHNAYISKNDIQLDATTIIHPSYHARSISVKGDEKYDYVEIAMEEKLPYRSWMEIDPAKIILEIYGVKGDINWITQLRSVKEIKEVYLNQPEDDVVRVTIELKHQQHWGYSIFYKKNTLSLRVRRQPQALKVNKLSIAIDAGHGGSDEGAVGAANKGLEKIYSLRYANELEQYLKKKGARVLLARTSDTTYGSLDRVFKLQQAMPHVMISLHFNSSANTAVKGVSTYYKHVGFKSLSTALLNRLEQLNLSEFGNVGNANYTLITPTDFPGTLVEIAFLTNAEDEKKIMDPRFQKSVVKKIYKGLKDWLKIAKE